MFRLTRFTWVTLVFNMGVIAMGAVVRATGSGAGCGPSWPTCQGVLVPGLEGATAIEFTHRAMSGVALVLVFALFVGVRRLTPSGHPGRAGALLSLVAIVGEALIGALIVLAEWVADDASVARAVAVPLHLVNTLFLLAALSLTAWFLGGGRRLDRLSDPIRWRWLAAGGAAFVVVAATGAVTALADTLFPKGAIGDEGTAHFLTRLRILHPIVAVGLAAIGWFVARRSPIARRGRPLIYLPLLVGAMLVSGGVNIALGTPLWMQVVHLILADLLWITFVLTSAQVLESRDRLAV